MNTGSYVNGKWYRPASGAVTQNINPADTSDVIAEYPLATAADVRLAIDAGQAVARALAAANRGLPQTGVLVSDAFASLHPGYLVIFSGIYATLDEAHRAAAAAQRLYPGAYPRRIAR